MPDPAYTPGPPNLPGPQTPEAALRTGAIIVAVFAAGVFMFALATLALTLTGQRPAPLAIRIPQSLDPEAIMLGAAVLIFSTSFAIAPIIRSSVVRPLRERADRGEPLTQRDLTRPFLTSTIVTAALFEGPSLLAVTVSFLYANALGLLLAGLGIACLVIIAMPTRAKYDAFVRDATGRMPSP